MKSFAATLATMLLCTLTFLATSTARSAEIAGTNLPDRVSIEGRPCLLTGSGLRKKFFIKVYAAGFYQENPESSLERAITSDQPKAMLMQFIHDGISGEKLQDAWREGFQDNTPDPSADLRERISAFTSLFSATAHKGDRVLMAYLPGRGTTVSFNDRQAATITGRDFIEALLRIWFGSHPADSGLKEQMARELSNFGN